MQLGDTASQGSTCWVPPELSPTKVKFGREIFKNRRLEKNTNLQMESLYFYQGGGTIRLSHYQQDVQHPNILNLLETKAWPVCVNGMKALAMILHRINHLSKVRYI